MVLRTRYGTSSNAAILSPAIIYLKMQDSRQPALCKFVNIKVPSKRSWFNPLLLRLQPPLNRGFRENVDFGSDIPSFDSVD